MTLWRRKATWIKEVLLKLRRDAVFRPRERVLVFREEAEDLPRALGVVVCVVIVRC